MAVRKISSVTIIIIFPLRRQAWQSLEPAQTITDKSCPHDYAGWNFSGKEWDEMKAECATAKEVEKAGKCLPEDHWFIEETNTTVQKTDTKKENGAKKN